MSNLFIHPSSIFRYFLLCFLTGILIRSFIEIDVFRLYVAILILVIATYLCWKKPYLRWLLLGGFFVITGIIRYQLSLPAASPTTVWFYANQTVTLQGIVAAEPDVRIDHVKLTVQATQLQRQERLQAVHGKVLVSVSLYPRYRYGDLLQLSCRLRAPEAFSGFAYDRYLAKSSIYALCSYPRVTLIERNRGNPALAAILGFKERLQLTMNRNLPEPSASLLGALLIGSRSTIPEELLKEFSVTGTTHLIAISGLNITIIASFLLEGLLALGFWRRQAFWCITGSLILFVVLVGFPASAVRAALMGWLVLLAMHTGRLSSPANLLTFAATVMVLINPKVLRDDIGFQLSFAAIVGIIYLTPVFERWLAKLPSVGGIRSLVTMTLGAQLTTLPFIVYYFGTISLVGVAANLLVVPAVPYLMMSGIAAIVLSALLPSLSVFFFWPVWLTLAYLIAAVELLASVPFAAVTL